MVRPCEIPRSGHPHALARDDSSFLFWPEAIPYEMTCPVHLSETELALCLAPNEHQVYWALEERHPEERSDEGSQDGRIFVV